MLVPHSSQYNVFVTTMYTGEKGTAYTLLTAKDVQFAAGLVRNLVCMLTVHDYSTNRSTPLGASQSNCSRRFNAASYAGQHTINL